MQSYTSRILGSHTNAYFTTNMHSSPHATVASSLCWHDEKEGEEEGVEQQEGQEVRHTSLELDGNRLDKIGCESVPGLCE